MAKLFFRYGAMNSGKTTLLMQTAHNYEEQNMKALVVKPSLDTKGQGKIVSRIGITRKVDLLINREANLFNLVKSRKGYACVLIDEAQFLTRKQVDEALLIAIDLDIPVICFGLRTDFLTNGFEGSTRLLEVAHTLEEMKTICKCGKKAIFNARYVNDVIVTEGNQVAIDGEDVSYRSMCAKCYNAQKKLK